MFIKSLQGSLQAEKRDVAGLQEKVFVRKVIELLDKYLTYVNDCFNNHTLFHKVLKRAFEIFCNMGVAGSSRAKLLATFCDNILKKGGSEKLSDEAIEDTLEKFQVVKLLAYINDKDVFAEFYRCSYEIGKIATNVDDFVVSLILTINFIKFNHINIYFV
ncbi:hypothetical protein L1987_04025 [Smallanthus sonchifolius]|uniref:Uncharacterized protein n=1 Tax=Smallanthus sonchifolius TaxID=185202 RepID=A0ACB9KCB0_9ASTR|nr:hypothetical protein L1987_04025 [Smallanthus sonchifolius]